jgi:ribonuclease D
MSSEKAVMANGEQLHEGDLVHSLIKQIKDGASRETVLLDVPPELRKKIEDELDREEAAKKDQTPSTELIPAEYQGLTSRMLADTWTMDEKTVEGELEHNRKIAALDALRREEAELIKDQTKEIERAAQRQSDMKRMGQLKSELREEPHSSTLDPVHISSGEIESMLSESNDRHSFHTRLKAAYQNKLDALNTSVGDMVREDISSVPDFMKESMREKYGRKE